MQVICPIARGGHCTALGTHSLRPTDRRLLTERPGDVRVPVTLVSGQDWSRPAQRGVSAISGVG